MTPPPNPPPPEELPGLDAEMERYGDLTSCQARSSVPKEMEVICDLREIAEKYESRRIAAERRCAIYEEGVRAILFEYEAYSWPTSAIKELLERADREAPWPGTTTAEETKP